MIGLFILVIGAAALVGYLWLIGWVIRFTKHKTGSNVAVALAVIGIFVVTFGDTAFNRWYHTQVLCKRSDVGVTVFKRIAVPDEYLDAATQRLKLPLPLEQPFFARFSNKEERTREGWFPMTAHGRIERSIIDTTTGEMVARLVNYWPEGGPWWATPIKWFKEDTIVGWMRSRWKTPTCFAGPASSYSLFTTNDYFQLLVANRSPQANPSPSEH